MVGYSAKDKKKNDRQGQFGTHNAQKKTAEMLYPLNNTE